MKDRLSIHVQMIFALLLLAAAGALWFGQDHVSKVFAAITKSDPGERAGAERGERKVPVVVERVRMRADDAAIEAIATARAKRFVTIYPEAPGEVVEVGVEAGQRVKQGDVILRLDARAAKLAVELAKVRLEEATTMLERSQQLLQRNVNPLAKVDDARSAVERSRLELRQAEEALADRTLLAPLDGIVGIPKVEVGDRITPATALVTLDDRSELIVEVEVPEEYLARIRTGQNIAARTPSFPAQTFDGEVERIDSRVDPATRRVMVRAKLPNHKDLLRPGMSFAVKLIIPGDSLPTVPELALQWAKGESYVWRIDNESAEKVAVRTIKRENSFILVQGELKKGDLVVVEGVQRLRPGRSVRFARPDRQPES